MASTLVLPQLKRCCEREITRNVDAANVGEMLALAQSEGMPEVEAWCVAFAVRALPAEGAVRALATVELGQLRLLAPAGHLLHEIWRV